MQGEERTNVIDVLIEAALIAFICLPPLALGSVSPWTQGALFFAALCLLALWLIQCAWRGRLRLARTFAWVLLLAFIIVVVAQLLPLSQSALRALSPGSAEIYSEILPAYATNGGARSISLHPYATGAALVRMLMLGMVFFVLVNSVRSRWQVMGLVLALVAVGGFEALYGLGEQFSGYRHIFWMPRQFHLAGPTGTFHNKNHFAGLLLMIIPVAFGLVFAGFRRRSRREALLSPAIPAGVRLSRALSSPVFYRQGVLVIIAAVMVLAVIFSLSRAGVFCMAATLVALLVCLGMAAHLRRYTIVMFLIVAAIIGVSFGIGMELVISRAEDVISGESASWGDRLDMWRSGVRWWRDFPLLGSGLGTCRAVILRYQSIRFGDRVADFIHNDWLQIFCETGVAGGLLLIIGCGWFLARAAGAARRRRQTLARWVTAGALTGVGAMLMHSFFDYNLSKITSNALVFVILLGLAYATAHLPSDGDEKATRRGYWTLNLRSWPARAILVLIAAAVVAAGWWIPCASIGADIHFNRYLARALPWLKPDAYFFLRADRESTSGSPSDLLERARELDRYNPRYIHAAAHDLLAQADALVEGRARDAARTILGGESETEDPRGFEEVVVALKKSLRATVAEERRDSVSDARKLLEDAVWRAPTKADYHSDLADTLLELDPRDPAVQRETRIALSLAPNQPAILFNTARVLLAQARTEADAEAREALLDVCLASFRRAIHGDPAYAVVVYPIVRAALPGPRALLAVTPRSIRAYEQLYDDFRAAGNWEEVLACLDSIAEFVARRSATSRLSRLSPHPDQRVESLDDDGIELLPPGSTGRDVRSTPAIQLSVARRRCATLGILGRWDARAKGSLHYQALLREQLASNLDEAIRLRQAGRLRGAAEALIWLLERDWGNPEALLQAAELADKPDVAGFLPSWNEPIDHLYRLVIHNNSLDPEAYKRAMHVLKSLSLRTETDQAAADFVRGAAAVLAGEPERGASALEAMSKRAGNPSFLWRQKHLIWFYLGRAREDLGQNDAALAAYRHVIELVPGHASALERLAALGADVGDRLKAIRPAVACNVTFGGRITLVGMSLTREAADGRGNPHGKERLLLTCVWKFHRRMNRRYRPVVDFVSSRRRVISRDGRRIAHQGRDYPMDYPRCGEVIIEKRLLAPDANPRKATYARIGIYCPNAPRLLPVLLVPDGGELNYLMTQIANVQSPGEPREGQDD